jgi:hypothetical protein
MRTPHKQAAALAALLLGITLASVSTADAARWKSGPRPAGTTYQERVGVRVSGSTVIGTGVCHYNTAESGALGNQCRYKGFGDSCKWVVADSGPNQCNPADYNAATLTATNGTVTFKSLDDGDGNPETLYGDVVVRYAKTGEVVTTRVHLRVSTTNPLYADVTASTVTGLQSTTLNILRGDATYPWVLERGQVLNAAGARVAAWGYRPRQDYFLLGDPVPPAPPPGGYACGVSYADFMSSQINCFGGWAGTAIEGAFINAMYTGWRAGVTCVTAARVAGSVAGGPGSLATFAGCEGLAVGPAFGYNLIESVYLGYSGGYSNYAAQACNSINQARMTAYQNCQPFIPPVMP